MVLADLIKVMGRVLTEIEVAQIVEEEVNTRKLSAIGADNRVI